MSKSKVLSLALCGFAIGFQVGWRGLAGLSHPVARLSGELPADFRGDGDLGNMTLSARSNATKGPPICLARSIVDD